jgi:tetratricopeptide (TPR) repeat protein
MGAAFSGQGKYDEAIKYLAKALELNPRYPDAHNKISLAYIQTGRYKQAIENLRQAAKLQPVRIDVLNNLAAAYAASGRFEEAVMTAQKAIDAAKAAGQEELAGKIQDRKKLYEASQRYWQSRMSEDGGRKTE